MKVELSIEEKAKRYDEAIKVANKYKDTHIMFPQIKDEIFPELKESEDERIRKGLIKYFRDFNLDTFAGLDPKKILAWLEKQGEKPQGKSALEAIKEEKVDNQNCVKVVDKVEPKFKVGDWIVRELDKTCYQIKKCILNVTNNKYGYDLTSGGYISSQDANFYHLWTIQDTKPGDVLVDVCDSLDNPLIFIVKDFEPIRHEYGKSDYHSFCYLKASKRQEFCVEGWHNEHKIMPATKEQRDLLFQKMKEAGYEWDVEKKELKKIEQNPSWSEEDELSCFESALFTAFSDAWQSYLLGSEVNVKQWAKEHSKELLEAAKEELKEPTASDRGMAEEIIINLKRVEQDYHIDLTREMEWLRNQVKKGE